MPSRWPAIRCAALIAAMLPPVGPAYGQRADPSVAPEAAPQPNAVDLRAAQRKFSQGEAAFRAGDFSRAGDAFEAANTLAPHEDALWNAARARHRAGELARAANLYARYLREAKGGARERNRATMALAQLAAKLGRIEVQAPALDALTIDGIPVDGRSWYVDPGSHIVHARLSGGDQERMPSVGAGEVLSVAFEDVEPAAPTSPPPPESAGPISPAPPPEATMPEALPSRPAVTPPEGPAGPPPSTGGLRPWVFFVAGAMTLGAGIATTVSAIDTRQARNAFDGSPSEQALSAGQSKEIRTNVLLGVTSGLALLTAVTGIWLVRWNGSPTQTGAALSRVSIGAACDARARSIVAEGAF